MHKIVFQKSAGTLLLAAGLIAVPLSASASYTMDGVTFTFIQTAANELTLQIDASHHADLSSYTWATATNIGSIQVKDIGTFTSSDVHLSGDVGTSAFTNWTISNQELNAATTGCTGGSGGISRACTWADLDSGQQRVGPLTDNMLFHFTFTGGTLNFANPELKVQFFNGNGADKVGDQLSQHILTAVPEPDTWGMFVMGLGILAFLARPRKA